MTWLNPTATSTGTLIEMAIGTSTSGPPVPLIDERKPVTAPTTRRLVLGTVCSGASAAFCDRIALSPDKNVSRPRQASSNCGLTTLTAHAPAKAVGVAPRQSHAAMPQRIDLL